MRLIIAFLLSIAVCSAYSKDGTCKELIVWNQTPNDTLFHFTRKASDLMTKDGACYFNTGWTAKVITWHCKNMYLNKNGKSTFQKNHEGSISLRPHNEFYCHSIW